MRSGSSSASRRTCPWPSEAVQLRVDKLDFGHSASEEGWASFLDRRYPDLRDGFSDVCCNHRHRRIPTCPRAVARPSKAPRARNNDQMAKVELSITVPLV